MIVTIWKIRFTIKVLKVNGYLRKYEFAFLKFDSLDLIKLKMSETKDLMSFHQCVIFSFISWIFDLFFLPIKLISIVITPWRAPIIIESIIISDPRIPIEFSFRKAISQRRLTESLKLIADCFLDYSTIIAAGILFLSIYKIYNVAHILYHNSIFFIKNKEKQKQALLEIRKEIWTQLVMLLFDIVMAVLGIIVIFLILRAYYFVVRIFKIVKKYFQLRTLINTHIEFYKKHKSKARIFSIPNNIFIETSQFLDVGALTVFSNTCSAAQKAVSSDLIWKKHFYRTYSKLSAPLQNATFRQLCIDGYINEKTTNKSVSQDERDWVVGWRMIVAEEFTTSLIAMPHLIVLPTKILAVVFYMIKNVLMSVYQKFLVYSKFNLIFKELEGRFSVNDSDLITRSNIHNFWRMHNVFTDAILNIFVMCSAFLAYHYTLLIYYYYYILSGLNMIRIVKTEESNIIQQANFLRFNIFYGYLQLLSIPLFIFLLTFPFFGITLVWWHYLDESFINCFIGPKCVNIFFYYTAINIDLTALDLKKFFPMFKPSKGIIITSAQALPCVDI